jgi:hypothetical protein
LGVVWKTTNAAFLTGSFSSGNYSLKDYFLLDSGTTIHICNNRDRLLNYYEAPPDDFVRAGDSNVPVLGYGEVDLRVQRQGKIYLLRLYEVAFCKDFACSVVSMKVLRSFEGLWWDNKPPNNALRDAVDDLVAEVTERYDQFILESPTPKTALLNSWNPDRVSRASALLWHRRLGHPGPEVIANFTEKVTGARVVGPKTVECEACAIGKLNAQVSRRPKEGALRAGLRWAIDFLEFDADSYGFDRAMLFTDRFSGFVFIYYTVDKKGPTLLKCFRDFLTLLRVQYNIVPEVFEADHELTRYDEVKEEVKKQGFQFENSAPNTPAQNGPAERSGGVIKKKSIVLRTSSKLPYFLWREIYSTSVYLHNRTPKAALGWYTPYQVFFEAVANAKGIRVPHRMPNTFHLRAFGCKAYCLTFNAKKGFEKKKSKLAPKAFIGYLVGYESTNIYRIWYPGRPGIHLTRDVIFDEEAFFDGDTDKWKDDLFEMTEDSVQELFNSFTWKEAPVNLGNVLPQEEEEPPLPTVPFDVEALQEAPVEAQAVGEDDVRALEPSNEEEIQGQAETDHLYAYYNAYFTPEVTPPPPNDLLAKTSFFSSVNQSDHQLPPRVESNSGTHLVNIAPEPFPYTTRFAVWAAAFCAGRLASNIGTVNGKPVTKTKLQSLIGEGKLPTTEHSQPEPPTVPTVPRIHRRDLPPPPKNHHDLKNHSYRELFVAAEKDHLKSHKEMKSWIQVPHTTAGKQQILDCMWVYIYKFDKHGYLQKAKARLVVRGDQQTQSPENTYAATLAGRSFKTLIAIAARFDLELLQYDVVNAFVHTCLPYPIYMRGPPGYRTTNSILQLKKALYGLKESPLLWQKDFTASLHEQGFRQICHEACCYVKGDVMIFFYVDDIVVACRKDKLSEAKAEVERLGAKYSLSGGGNLQWYLGVEVIRDRQQRKIWLAQSDYIAKLSRHLPKERRKRPPTHPMTTTELLPYEGRATEADLQRFQRATGSVLYAAVVTRADIAFAVSRLTRFNHNPGPDHFEAVYRVIDYLLKTQNLAIELGGGDDYETFSDASFADNSLDRKSSQAYAMKLFGGIVAWRANKQDTVTTSTTEAELLALSQAAKEALFVNRLLNELGVEFDNNKIKMWCDNQQTLRLLQEEGMKLSTKLRHVDIHNHWLRERVQEGHIEIEYIQSKEMLADGLTKALTSDAFVQWRRKLGLVDVSDQILARRLNEVSFDYVDLVEDSLPSGAIAV